MSDKTTDVELAALRNFAETIATGHALRMAEREAAYLALRDQLLVLPADCEKEKR